MSSPFIPAAEFAALSEAEREQHVATCLAYIRAALACDIPTCRCHRKATFTHCPAHDDKHPSLFNDQRGSRLIFQCMGRKEPCTTRAIRQALYLRGLWHKPVEELAIA